MTEPVRLSQWITHVFDHPVTDPAWHFSIDSRFLDPGPTRVAELIAETFEAAGTLLQPFSDAQLNQAFWFLVSSGNSDYMFCLSDHSVQWPLRRRALRSFVPLFRQVMAPRCSPVLSHRDEPADSPLNSACFMWWDIVPLSESQIGDPSHAALTDEVLTVLSELVDRPHDACRESALHGLGHWALFNPQAAAIIDSFLTHAQGLRPDLIAYATQAKSGDIL